MGFDLLGASERLFEQTLDYLKSREQFGVLIGTFQALQHRGAHWYAELATTRALLWRPLEDVAGDAPDAAAKIKASAVGISSGNKAIQMHGGIGMTDEVQVGWGLRRARVGQMSFGDERYHRERFAALLGI
ncbi:MAG: acyl-CoA dehydrogenase family protein [Parcubacteria group bacterium]